MNQERKISFTLKEGADVKYFKGTLDASGTRMKGKWKYNQDDIAEQRFDFVLADNIRGTMILKFADTKEI